MSGSRLAVFPDRLPQKQLIAEYGLLCLGFAEKLAAAVECTQSVSVVEAADAGKLVGPEPEEGNKLTLELLCVALRCSVLECGAHNHLVQGMLLALLIQAHESAQVICIQKANIAVARCEE